ncbi:MAG TPA: hypothetical protein PLC42_01600 [Parachlamydiaceae bacterium]|nr:hypothetical protein [Parachlamydiaceae bacterium]
MKNALILSTLLIGLSFATFAAEPNEAPKRVRTLQTKSGKKIRSGKGQIAKVKQSGFHKSLG